MTVEKRNWQVSFLYILTYKKISRKGACRMEEGRISFQQGFKEFLIMMVCFWLIMFLMYGESLLQ
ncbi:hypothetical protein BTJ45_03296 [Bacillus mycoides]|nr:hypothetical protein BTJ45_03296 [Bacillus mycoides]